MIVYICTKFRGDDSDRKKFKGHNSVKNVGGVLVLVLCISSDNGLHLYQVS